MRDCGESVAALLRISRPRTVSMMRVDRTPAKHRDPNDRTPCGAFAAERQLRHERCDRNQQAHTRRPGQAAEIISAFR